MKNRDMIRLVESRKKLIPPPDSQRKQEMEGGCGVVGLACNEKISGRHIMQALVQMHNRGNSKGGGVAAFGLDARQLGVDQMTLDEDYLIQIAYLDPSARKQVEEEFLLSNLNVHSYNPLKALELMNIRHKQELAILLALDTAESSTDEHSFRIIVKTYFPNSQRAII